MFLCRCSRNRHKRLHHHVVVMSLVWTRAKQSFFLSSASGPSQSTSARQLSTPAGRGNVTDCQSSTGFKGDHCSHVPGSGRKYSGGGKNADNTTFDNGSCNTDSSLSGIQASTARKKSSAGLGENNKTVQILIRRCLQDTKMTFHSETVSLLSPLVNPNSFYITIAPTVIPGQIIPVRFDYQVRSCSFSYPIT